MLLKVAQTLPDELMVPIRKNSSKGTSLDYSSDRAHYMPKMKQAALAPWEYADGKIKETVLGVRGNQPDDFDGKEVMLHDGKSWALGKTGYTLANGKSTGKRGRRCRWIFPMDGIDNLMFQVVHTALLRQLAIVMPELYATKNSTPEYLYGHNPFLEAGGLNRASYGFSLDFGKMDHTYIWDILFELVRWLPREYLEQWAILCATRLFGAYINDKGEPVYWSASRPIPDIRDLSTEDLVHFTFEYMHHYSGTAFTSLLNWLFGVTVMSTAIMHALKQQVTENNLIASFRCFHSGGDDNLVDVDSQSLADKIHGELFDSEQPVIVKPDDGFLGMKLERDRTGAVSFVSPNWLTTLLYNPFLKEKGGAENLIGLHAPITGLYVKTQLVALYAEHDPFLWDKLNLLFDLLHVPYTYDQLEEESKRELENLENGETYATWLAAIGARSLDELVWRDFPDADQDIVEELRSLVFESIPASLKAFNDSLKYAGTKAFPVKHSTGVSKVLLTGMPGCGKTSVARLYDAFTDMDRYGHMVKDKWFVQLDKLVVGSNYVGVCDNLAEVLNWAVQHHYTIYAISRPVDWLASVYSRRYTLHRGSFFREAFAGLADDKPRITDMQTRILEMVTQNGGTVLEHPSFNTITTLFNRGPNE